MSVLEIQRWSIVSKDGLFYLVCFYSTFPIKIFNLETSMIEPKL